MKTVDIGEGFGCGGRAVSVFLFASVSVFEDCGGSAEIRIADVMGFFVRGVMFTDVAFEISCITFVEVGAGKTKICGRGVITTVFGCAKNPNVAATDATTTAALFCSMS